MKSTPVRATSARLSSVMPPLASSRARLLARATAARISSIEKLSSRISGAPASRGDHREPLQEVQGGSLAAEDRGGGSVYAGDDAAITAQRAFFGDSDYAYLRIELREDRFYDRQAAHDAGRLLEDLGGGG